MKKKRILISIPIDIYNILLKYKKFSGEPISSTIQVGLMDYLTNIGFLDLNKNKPNYKEISYSDDPLGNDYGKKTKKKEKSR